jgi:hypothetical protein
LSKPVLELALGQPVQFPLFSSTVREQDKAGDILTISPEQLAQLPPLHTVLRGGKRSTGVKMVPVALFTRITEIGTLELFCVARDGNNRWRLEFNIRELVKEAPRREEEEDDKSTLTDVWPEAQVQEAARLIRGAFVAEGESNPPPQELTKALENALEASREKWPTGLCRRLWEALADVAEQRKRSPQHLSRWYHLAGYCLRPGFGDSLDKFRVEQLWKLLHAKAKDGGRAALTGAEGGADAWIMWRRVCGGLNLPLQQNLYDRLRPILLPKGKVLIKPGANELAEMWRAAASLERLDPKPKEALGQALLKLVRKSPVPFLGPDPAWGARALLRPAERRHSPTNHSKLARSVVDI